MRSLLLPLFLFSHLGALAGLAAAQSYPYNITAQYVEDGVNHQLRTWYGDGQMYVGDVVPPGIVSAFNYTVPNTRADLLYITAIPPTNSSTTNTTTLPDPTFLVLDNAPGAFSPLFFAHSAAGLGEDHVVFWLRYEVVLFPVLGEGRDLVTHYYLDATGVEGTYVVKWKTGGERGRGKRGGDWEGDGMEELRRKRAPLAGRSVNLLTSF